MSCVEFHILQRKNQLALRVSEQQSSYFGIATNFDVVFGIPKEKFMSTQ